MQRNANILNLIISNFNNLQIKWALNLATIDIKAMRLESVPSSADMIMSQKA
ncbi:MAG: hypothetical protein ACFFAN_00155 [Promethearchaeota archaeon]